MTSKKGYPGIPPHDSAIIPARLLLNCQLKKSLQLFLPGEHGVESLVHWSPKQSHCWRKNMSPNHCHYHQNTCYCHQEQTRKSHRDGTREVSGRKHGTKGLKFRERVDSVPGFAEPHYPILRSSRSGAQPLRSVQARPGTTHYTTTAPRKPPPLSLAPPMPNPPPSLSATANCSKSSQT